MARRADVFQSKVLQRLYPATRNVEKEQSPPGIVEALAKKKHVKRDATKSQSAANPGRRLYTVLPPPADYNIHSQESVTLPQLESINSAEDPAAVEKAHDGDEQSDEGKEAEEQQWRKRRRRKRKQGSRQDSEKHGEATVSESGRDHSQAAADEGQREHISKNKRRKLKKKRHKDKLLSMGLMPQAAALEFTYQKEKEEEEEEDDDEDDDDERRAAEVSDFLRTTMEIYMSDSSLHVDKVPHLSATVDDLLGAMAGGCKRHSVLKQLYNLKVFVRHNKRDELEKALKELENSSSMTAEETAAVVSLFQYWITDILPMRGDEKTMLSATHP